MNARREVGENRLVGDSEMGLFSGPDAPYRCVEHAKGSAVNSIKSHLNLSTEQLVLQIAGTIRQILINLGIDRSPRDRICNSHNDLPA
jgi:hypothetical protein